MIFNRPAFTIKSRTRSARFFYVCILALIASLGSIHAKNVLAFELTEQLGDAGSIRITAGADSAAADKDRILLDGDALLIFQEVQMDADQVLYEPETGRAEAAGSFRLLQPDVEIRGDHLRYNTQTRDGTIGKGQFALRYKEGRGSAKEIRIDDGKELEFKKVEYTSCPMGDNGWLLSAKEIDIDLEKRQGTADDAVLRFEGVPILYLPKFWFPVGNERQSGFLTPVLGNSSRSGFKIGAPYYWNIADNYDATITPRLLTKRGFQLSTEFRYLHEDDAGIVEAEFTPRDSITNEGRSLVSWRHYKAFNKNTTLNIDLANASDREYLEDYGSSLNITSQVFLPQLVNLQWQGDDWLAAANVEAYQTLGDNLATQERPYRRLPQLLLQGSEAITEELQATMDVDWTWFHHSSLANGQRFYAAPGLRWQRNTAGRSLSLTSEWQYRRYEGNTGGHEMALPYFGADASWTFVEDRNDGWLHTLTPRFAYRLREFKNQNHLPVFDSRLAEFGFEELFAANRFVGLDRLGDANQLGMGLVARWQKADQDFRLSLGEILYFSRPEVGSATGNNQRSDWLAEFTASYYPNWQTRLYLQTDEQLGKIEQSTVQLSYKYSNRQRINAAYRYQRENQLSSTLNSSSLNSSTNFGIATRSQKRLEQLDISGIWPVGERWHVVGRWLHSINSRRTLETLAGFEYQSCCWTVRLAGRRYVTDVNEYDSSVLLQLELHGLGSIGDGLERFISDY